MEGRLLTPAIALIWLNRGSHGINPGTPGQLFTVKFEEVGNSGKFCVTMDDEMKKDNPTVTQLQNVACPDGKTRPSACLTAAAPITLKLKQQRLIEVHLGGKVVSEGGFNVAKSGTALCFAHMHPPGCEYEPPNLVKVTFKDTTGDRKLYIETDQLSKFNPWATATRVTFNEPKSVPPNINMPALNMGLNVPHVLRIETGQHIYIRHLVGTHTDFHVTKAGVVHCNSTPNPPTCAYIQ